MVVMVVILKKFFIACSISEMLAEETRTPIHSYYFNSNEKKLFIILAMISISRMKNSVYNLIGLEDSCIRDHCLTDYFCQFRLLK